jgi:hypothetical protein
MKTGYKTKDIYLASTLLCLGYTIDELQETEEEGKKTFFFVFSDPNIDTNGHDKIRADVDRYWKNEIMVDARSLYKAFREIKDRMYGSK